MSFVGLHQDGEALEAGTKKFEDLEFQQLERESSLEEERETMSQQLLLERAEYHSSVAKRKVSFSTVECFVTEALQSCRIKHLQVVYVCISVRVVSFRRRFLLWRPRPTSFACRRPRSTTGWSKTRASRCKCSKR